MFVNVSNHFDKFDGRFDTLELKIDHLTSESRSYFKRRLDDRTHTHEMIIRKYFS